MAELAGAGTAPEIKSSRARQWGIVPTLVAVVLFTFFGVLGNAFVHYDDAQNIYNNPHVEGLSGPNVAWMLTDTRYAPRYMPLGWMCYALDRQLFGLNPGIWHAGNLLFHALNSVLLFFLLKKLAGRAVGTTPSGDSRPDWCAGIAALLWAVNPLRVEIVGWASARIYEVVVLFVLIWLLAWIEAETAATPLRRRLFSWISLSAYAASLFTYPLALFAPAVLFALDIFPLRRAPATLPLRRAPATLRGWFARESRPLWRDKVPFFIVAAVVLIITAAVRIGADEQFRSPTLQEFGLVDRLMQAAYVLGYYAWKPLVPSSLAASYPTLHAFNPLGFKFIASLVAVVGATIFAVREYRRWPAVFAVVLCHAAVLFPVLGLTEYPHSPFDRYSYLHGLLWSAAFACGLCAIWHVMPWRTIAASVALGASCVFVFLSRAQAPVWHDTISLYENIVARFGEHPGRGRFDEVLGVYYLRAGRTNDAVASFYKAIDYDNRRTDRNIYVERVIPRCERRLADVSARTGDPAGAARHYAEALKSEWSPLEMISISVAYSRVLTELDRPAEAVTWLEKALELSPESAALHRQLGAVLQKLGREGEAQRHFQEERRLLAASRS